MTKPIQLMITCDDGALSNGVDTMVIELFRQNKVSIVSVMTNQPQSRTALQQYKDLASLEIGAHLTLTEGSALTPAMRHSRLADGINFKGRFALFTQALWLTKKVKKIIYDELDAQMAVFFEEHIQPAHITTHHHFHVFPALFDIIYTLAIKYNVHWIRNPQLSSASVPNNIFLKRDRQPVPSDRIIQQSDHIVLLQAWVNQPLHKLIAELQSFTGTIELITHPCTIQDPTFPKNVLYQPAERYEEVKLITALWDTLGDQIERVQLRSQQ